MSGYESYVSSFPDKPEYTREVLYPYYGHSLYTMLRKRGIKVETENNCTKILSSCDGAKSYQMSDGGIAEVMPDQYSGEYVLIVIHPDQASVYRKYQAPLPFWAYSMG